MSLFRHFFPQLFHTLSSSVLLSLLSPRFGLCVGKLELSEVACLCAYVPLVSFDYTLFCSHIFLPSSVSQLPSFPQRRSLPASLSISPPSSLSLSLTSLSHKCFFFSLSRFAPLACAPSLTVLCSHLLLLRSSLCPPPRLYLPVTTLSPLVILIYLLIPIVTAFPPCADPVNTGRGWSCGGCTACVARKHCPSPCVLEVCLHLNSHCMEPQLLRHPTPSIGHGRSFSASHILLSSLA